MIYAKFIDENKIKYCPRNGVLNTKKAISNLNAYFTKNPAIALKNGYMPVIEGSCDEDGDYIVKYSVSKNKIIQTFIKE